MRRSTGTLRGNQSRFTVDSFSLRRSRAALTIFLLQHKRSSIFLLRCTPGVYHPPTPITSGVEKEGVRASIDTTRAHSNNGCWFMLGVAGCSFSNFFSFSFYSKRIWNVLDEFFFLIISGLSFLIFLELYKRYWYFIMKYKITVQKSDDMKNMITRRMNNESEYGSLEFTYISWDTILI